MYNKTPFERMHDAKSASSDSDSADNSPSFQRFSIRTETPHPEQQSDSLTNSPVMNHTPPYSLTDSSESEVEASHSSPDFLKFRPGLLSENRSDIDTTSPDFPKFRSGLLGQQNSEAVNSSPDFPKFRPGLLNPNNNTTSPDFPKFRPGLLSQDQASTGTLISPDVPNFKTNLTDQENTTVSPDFPKFRPGLLNGHPSVPFFKLQPPPVGHQSSSDPGSNSIVPARPLSPSGCNTQHLKCPVSPLARTSAQARFPQIRSILKAAPAGHALVSQQSKPMGSPLMRRVLQHNADRLLMRKSTMATIDDRRQDANNSKTLLDQVSMKGASSPTSPPYSVPQTMLTNYTTEIPDVLRSHDHTIPQVTAESVNNMIVQSPVTSPTEQEVKINMGTPPHVHFAGTAIEERLNEETEDGDNCSLKKADTSPLLAGPAIFCIAPTPPINQAEVPSKETTPSPLHHQDDRPKPPVSVSPKIPMRYSRRKSVTFEGELVHAGPLRSYHSRKSPLSPISSRYHKRRRSVSTVSHKQKSEHQMFAPSPHVPSHVYRKVSLSPIHSRPFKIKNNQLPLNQTQQDVKVPSPHLPTHVYRNVPPSPMNYKRRKSISVLPHHQTRKTVNFPVSTRYNKRRKSVSILVAQGESGHKITSPRHYHKRRKSVSIVNGPESNHPSVVSRHHIRRKSLAVVSHHKGYRNGGFSPNSRHYKRRRSESIMSQYQHDKHVIPSPRLPVHVYRNISLPPKYTNRTHGDPESNNQAHDDNIDYLSPPIPSMNAPMSPINYKRRRRSILSVGQDQTRPLTPKSPGRFFRKHLPSPFIFGRSNRRKSVLVINRDDRLIPLTSPMFNRITLGAYERSLPATPIPRRFARRKSLSVITPRTRRRVENDEQIQVTMEAARFDVTSIYSSKSFLSLAPTEISREKPEFKTKKQKVGC